MYTLPIVKVTYKGKALSQKEFDQQPEIHHLYPSKEDFMQKHFLPLLEEVRKTGKQKVLHISEEGFRITEQ